eukprot:Skav226244  [mRNA]  locus=scaffold1218:568080:569018:- [translate_table: standard]
MAQVDKVLDADPGLSHEFLKACERLVKLKTENPKIRLTGSTPRRESVLVSEQDTSGLRAPKRSFMELSAYEKRYGPAPAGKIKTINWKGKTLRGVDVEGIYEYIDETTKQVSRNTELTDADIDIGGGETIFNAALSQLSAGMASDPVVIQAAQTPPVPATAAAGSNDLAPDGNAIESEDLFGWDCPDVAAYGFSEFCD